MDGVGRENGKLLNEYRVSGLQKRKSSGDLLINNVKLLNITELYIFKRLRDKFYIMWVLPQFFFLKM